jgi:nicotinamide-nucleotide amidase
MFRPDTVARASELLDLCRAKGLHLATAESCTGGLIAGCLTEIAGSSDVFDRAFVTYSNAAKQEVLGVPGDLIDSAGAVSEDVARAMAEGALARADAELVVSCTGIAGPTGGSADKPVGLVHMAATRKGHETRHRRHDFGAIGRDQVRLETVDAALALILELAAAE